MVLTVEVDGTCEDYTHDFGRGLDFTPINVAELITYVTLNTPRP